MSELCGKCGEGLVDGLCMACDVADAVDVAVPSSMPPDPLLGRVFADRYEIKKLHGAGGMARVYRAVQRSLEREVVVKVISPELLTQGELTADEACARFFIEAQAASKLNHPNVVSVFDFGRTSPADGGLLFLVMEFLTGPDLWTTMQQDRAMPFSRVAGILQQTLAALAEAHHVGIAHRDVKPENILLEPTRGGRDLVKVIDFGTAKLGGLQSVTKVGQTVGTPHYMAPEQIEGSALGSADLYSVGIILFELLTGQLPFDGQTPIEILKKHLHAPRPDPREVAPEREIPAALANVCVRAMHTDPAQRYPDADALAEAIVRAAGATEWSSRGSIPGASMFPPPQRAASIPPPARPPSAPPTGRSSSLPPERVSSLPPVPRLPRLDGAPSVPPPRPSVADGTYSVRMTTPRRTSVAPPGILGRDADLAWAAKLLSGRGGWLGLHGAPGTGRSRLLREIADAAEKRGTRVVRAPRPRAPWREVTYGGLRALVTALTGLEAGDGRLTTGAEAADDATAADGLRFVFGPAGGGASCDEVRAGAAAAFAWAARRAVERARGTRILCVVDDADHLDNASRAAFLLGLADLLVPSFSTLTTSEAPLALPADRAAQRPVAGLAPGDAASLLEHLGGSPDLLAGREQEIAPLQIELLRRCRLDDPVPARLPDLVATALRSLSASQRRLLLAVAVTGGGTREGLGAVARREDLGRAVDPLAASGLLEVDGEGIRPAHEIFGRVAIATAPGEAVAELHTAAARALEGRADLAEVRAYHAVRGRPDFETFMLVEDAAALRARAGDGEGAADMLWAAMRAGRTMLRHGELEEGGSACVVFGQKLGAALRGLGRYGDAVEILEESLPLTGAEDLGRARILEELARSSGSLGRRPDAERFRREALAIARRRDERPLVQRLVAMARE